MDPDRILEEFDRSLLETRTDGNPPPLWDGNAAPRVVDEIESWFKSR
jgi:hypothetical protein